MLGGPGVILRGGLCPGRAISHTCVLPVFEFQACEVLCTNYVSRGLRTDRFGTACESRLTAEAFRPARPRARRHSACGLAIPSFLKRWGSKKFAGRPRRTIRTPAFFRSLSNRPAIIPVQCTARAEDLQVLHCLRIAIDCGSIPHRPAKPRLPLSTEGTIFYLFLGCSSAACPVGYKPLLVLLIDRD